MGIETKDTWTEDGKRIMAMIASMKKNQPYVKAGILAKDFEKPKETDDGEVDKDLTLGEVAVKNEYGDDKTPSRSFMRSTTDEKGASWQDMAERLWPGVMGATGKVNTLGKFLAAIGLKMESDIREKIRSDVGPPNSPATIARKTRMLTGRKLRQAEIAGAFGQGTLRDTGQMINAVASEVVNGGSE